MTQDQQNIFFSILRQTIWRDSHGVDGRDATDACDHHAPDWDVLIKAYKDHGILGVVADTIMDLPNEFLPPVAIQNAIVNHMATQLRMHWNLSNALIILFEKMESAGLHPILLKGQGFSQLYPMQRARNCGDMDIHCPNGEYFEAAKLLNSLCPEHYSREEQEECGHHLHYEFQGQVVELHRWVTDSQYENTAGAVNKWAEQWMQPERCHRVDVDGLGKSIRVPDNYFSMIYCIDHIYKHIRCEGVGVRQFVDLAVIYKSLRRVIDSKQLMKDLKACHLDEPWRAIQSVVALLVPEDEVIRHKISQKHLQRIKDYFFEGGNFGRKYEPISPETYLCLPHGLKRIKAIVHYNLHKYDRLRLFSFREYLQATKEEFVFTTMGSLHRRFNIGGFKNDGKRKYW